MKNNPVLTFITSWIAYYFLIAGLCFIANSKSMDYTDCLHSEAVWSVSFITGWLFAWAVVAHDKD